MKGQKEVKGRRRRMRRRETGDRKGNKGREGRNKNAEEVRVTKETMRKRKVRGGKMEGGEEAVFVPPKGKKGGREQGAGRREEKI